MIIAATTCPGFETAIRAGHDRPAVLVFSYANAGGPTSDRIVRLGARPGAQLEHAIPAITSAADGRRWFLAGSDICWPRAMHRHAKSIVDRAGGAVVGETLMPLEGSDPAPLVEAIDRSGAECVLSTFFGLNAVVFERAFHRAGGRERCLTLAPALDETTLEHIGAEAAHGIWSVTGYLEQLATAENQAFVRRYRDRFGACALPLSSFSESVYETVHLVAAAARRNHSWHPSEIDPAMLDRDFDGPRGRVSVAGLDGLRQGLFLAEATGRRLRPPQGAGQCSRVLVGLNTLDAVESRRR